MVFTNIEQILFYDEHLTDSDEGSEYDGDLLIDSEDLEVDTLTIDQLVKPTPKLIPDHYKKQNILFHNPLLRNKFEPDLEFTLSSENYIQCSRLDNAKKVLIQLIRLGNDKNIVNDRSVAIPNQLVIHYLASKISSHVLGIDEAWLFTNNNLLVHKPASGFRDLQQLTIPGIAIKEEIAKPIIKKVIYCLNKLHVEKISHRNIGMKSVLVEPNTLDVKLIGFENAISTEKRYSSKKEVVGDEDLYPPEVFRRRRFNFENVDAWQVGLLLFQLVQGSKPFDMDGRLKDVIMFNPRINLSEALEDLLLNLLHPMPDVRYKLKYVLRHRWFKTLKPMQSKN